MLRGSTTTLVACLTASALAVAAPASAQTRDAGRLAQAAYTCPDTAHHEDAARDGYNCSTLPAKVTKKWSVTLNAAASYPVIAQGRVFVTTTKSGGSGGSLYALSAQTGAVLWGPVPLSGTYTYFPLAYADGRVFVNNFDGTVSAYNAATGAQAWVTTTSDFSGEPVVAGGLVWIQGSGDVYGLSESTGAVEADSGYLDGDGAAPAVNGSGVYLSTGCQTQARLSLSGTTVWKDNDGCSGGGGGSTALWDSQMYGGAGNEILAQSSGKLLGTFAGVPAFSGTTGFFAAGKTLAALDVAKKETPVWSATLPSAVAAGPVATQAAVWVATSASKLVALNPATGAVLDSYKLPGVPGGGAQFSSTPSDIGVGNDMLIVPTGPTITAFG